jgi:hypothetical protein
MFPFFFCLKLIAAGIAVKHELDASNTRLMTTERFIVFGRYISELVYDSFDAVYLMHAWMNLDEIGMFHFVVDCCHIVFFLLVSTTVSQLKVLGMCDEMNPILTYLEVLSQNYLVGMINYIY